MRRFALAVLTLWLCLFALGCGARRSAPSAFVPIPSPLPSPAGIRFASVARQAGIHFTLGHNGRSPLTILETSGGGCAFLDYDGDGWPDILLVGPYKLALYRNLHNGTFADVTAGCGMAANRQWMGCAVGDYDGDGRPDIFLTGYHCCALYRNLGGGRFQDVTAQSGIKGLDWSMSAAFADLSGTGRLDLYVAQYVKFDASTPQTCQVGALRSACGPEVYAPLSGKMFLNVDGTHFRAAAWKDTGKTWGALASDLLGQGRPALYLANDMMPGDLWTRQGGAWRNGGVESGTAYDSMGHVQGGMGVDSGDYDNDGRLDLAVTTYFAQSLSLYHNDGGGLFTVTSAPAALAAPTTPYVKFGTVFADFDNDGWLDLIVTSGHVRDNVHAIDASQTYAQPIQVFHNQRGRFADVTAQAGDINGQPIVGRGLAVADYDLDGRPDVLVCNLEGEAVLLKNETPFAGHWLNVRLQETGPNRFGVGAMLTLQAGGSAQIREIRASGSVFSGVYPVAHFGLGAYAGTVTLLVRWPDGSAQQVKTDRLDTTLLVTRTSAEGSKTLSAAH